MRGHRWMIALLALAFGAGTALAQAPDMTALVRLSYVQGQVKVLQGDKILFDQAQANMPLLSGYALATGEDGQAEVEFTDGSVARVTPNSALRLDHLTGPDTRSETTELTMVSGLGYFELNTADGQHFAVHFNAAQARPVTNAIFRVDLDNAPDLAVFTGTVRASANGGFDQTVEEGSSLDFDPNDISKATTAAIRGDSWDQWNQDRDNQIAQIAQQQTTARENSGAANEPGWDDLDAYGDWYPMEGYGDVWVPSDQPADWDPFGNGYWANYPGWGSTWISGYTWGWLPYHCGAWNYWDSFGWGWVPGQCGLGFLPVVNFWNVPRGFRLPPRTIPGGHAGPPSRLVAVNRGPQLPNRGIINHHTQPVRVDGQRIDPLPVVENPSRSFRNTHTQPVGFGFAGNGGSGNRVTPPVQTAPGHASPPVITPTRPVSRPVPSPNFPGPVMPSPRTTQPPPPVSGPRIAPEPRVAAPAPRISSPPPAPRMSAPPPAPHFSAPIGGGPHR
jgi:FecR protein